MSVSAVQRRRIYERDGYRCVECGTSEDLTVDHIIPRSRGGSDNDVNLQTMCVPCNHAKADTVPPEVEDVLAKLAHDGVAVRVVKKLKPKKKKRPSEPRSRFGLLHHRHCDANYCFCECPVYLAEHPELARSLRA